MPVFLKAKKLAYIPVPKTACTSLKNFFYFTENGQDFTPFIQNGRTFHIHNVYPTVLFSRLPFSTIEDLERIIVIRDPISRFLSGYSNRVLHHMELSTGPAKKELRRRDLPVKPSLSRFIADLAGYRDAVPSINHHFRPLVDFSGKDSSYYSHIFPISELDRLVEYVAEKTGRVAPLPRLQTGGPKISVDSLSVKEMDVLRDAYSEDYDAFGAHL